MTNSTASRPHVLGKMDDDFETEESLSPQASEKSKAPTHGTLYFNPLPQVAETAWNVSKDATGSIIDLGKVILGMGESNPQQPLPEEDQKAKQEAQKKRFQQQQISLELNTAHSQAVGHASIEAKRARVNQQNNLSESYEGSVDSQGNVTIYHEANAQKAEAQNEANRIQQERDRKRFESKKSGKGFSMAEGELDKGGENFDHFTKAVA